MGLTLYQHFRSFVEAGRALQAIRDSGRPSKRLYRATHATFEDYCREKWGLTENYANKMIRGAQQYAAIKTGTKVPVLPDRESHVRELCRLESDAEAGENWTCKVSTAAVGTILGASCGCQFGETCNGDVNRYTEGIEPAGYPANWAAASGAAVDVEISTPALVIEPRRNQSARPCGPSE